MESLRGFLLVLSFFSRIPIGRWVAYTDARFRKGVHFFPLVGIVIALILAMGHYLLIHTNASPYIQGFLLTALYLLTTGAIHVDGLSDSFDGMLSARPKERVLEIMRDSRIGTFGALALGMLLIGYVLTMHGSAMLLFPLVGRVTAYIIASQMTYARESGMGRIFLEEARGVIGLIYFVLCILICYAWAGIPAVIAANASMLVAILLAAWSKKVIDGLTGDTMGMIVELSQLSFLLVLSMITGNFML